MAASRSKRGNAGSKMSKLLEDEEDVDDFYKTTYGGFSEENDDNDYASEASGSDEADSDFSIDENDELKSDAEDDDNKPKRKTGISTKSYKEPPKKIEKTPTSSKPKEKKRKLDRSSVQIYQTYTERKSLRKSTAQKSALTEEREKQREEKNKMLKAMAARKNVTEVRRLTQEELLAEARETEISNLKALATYQRMELEKKKNRVQKPVYKGPIIRYQSVTMPLIDELQDTDINVDEDGEGEPSKRTLKSSEKCSRTFVTFTDEKMFRSNFKFKRTKPPQNQYCAVTGLPAKYIDPITLLPYANSKAFKIIRDAYEQQVLSTEKRESSFLFDKRRQKVVSST